MTPIAFLSEATEKVRRHLEQRLKVRPNTNESCPTRSRRLVRLTYTGDIHDQDVESQHQADSNAAAVICWNYLFRVPVRRFEECLARTHAQDALREIRDRCDTLEVMVSRVLMYMDASCIDEDVSSSSLHSLIFSGAKGQRCGAKQPRPFAHARR